MNGISPSRFVVSWFRAALVAVTLGPSIALAQTADTNTESTSARAGSNTTPPASADSSTSVSSRTAAAHAFYVRTGVALDWSDEVRFKDRDCSSESPAALYGCGNGPDGAPLAALGDFGTIGGFELGVGHVATPLLRLEAAVQYRPDASFEGHANFLEDTRRQEVYTSVSSLSALIAAYADLPQIGVPRLGPFSPFVGAGVGLSRIEVDETRMEFPRTTTIVPGGTRTNLAWMVTAGVAVAVSERMTLDIAWRYTDFGTARTGRGRGWVVWRDGSREPLELDLAETRANLSSHGVVASLRYAF